MKRTRAVGLLASEAGFTIIELEIVCLIVAILAAVAVPTYLQFQDNAYKSAARSNVKGAVVAAELYAENNFPGSSSDPDRSVSAVDSGFQGMTTAELRTLDANLSPSVYVNNSGSDAPGVTKRATLDATHFCVYAAAGRWYAYQLNPSGSILTTTSAGTVCT